VLPKVKAISQQDYNGYMVVDRFRRRADTERSPHLDGSEPQRTQVQRTEEDCVIGETTWDCSSQNGTQKWFVCAGITFQSSSVTAGLTYHLAMRGCGCDWATQRKSVPPSPESICSRSKR
jgi:hypothetical protein